LNSFSAAVRRSARKATQNASNNSSKRKADAALQSASKRAKTEDETETEPRLDVIVQTGLYAAEMFASNVAVKHLINLVIVGVLFCLSTTIMPLSSSFRRRGLDLVL
jgi:hypothetical protein